MIFSLFEAISFMVCKIHIEATISNFWWDLLYPFHAILKRSQITLNFLNDRFYGLSWAVKLIQNTKIYYFLAAVSKNQNYYKFNFM